MEGGRRCVRCRDNLEDVAVCVEVCVALCVAVCVAGCVAVYVAVCGAVCVAVSCVTLRGGGSPLC